jgi:hypothetical protein
VRCAAAALRLGAGGRVRVPSSEAGWGPFYWRLKAVWRWWPVRRPASGAELLNGVFVVTRGETLCEHRGDGASGEGGTPAAGGAARAGTGARVRT